MKTFCRCLLSRNGVLLSTSHGCHCHKVDYQKLNLKMDWHLINDIFENKLLFQSFIKIYDPNYSVQSTRISASGVGFRVA